MRVMGRMLTLLWPETDRASRLRVLTAFALVAVAKVANVLVPLLYKLVVDALSVAPNAAITVPVAIVLGYSIIRVYRARHRRDPRLDFRQGPRARAGALSLSACSSTCTRCRCASISSARPAASSRAIERGTEGIEFLVSYLVFHIAPIFLEIVLVAAVLWTYFNFGFAAVTLLVVILYGVYTAGATQWRIKFRRAMNAQDREANALAIDSLLNFETVKYFGSEKHELDRFDHAKRDYVTAAIANQRALSLFKSGNR